MGKKTGKLSGWQKLRLNVNAAHRKRIVWASPEQGKCRDPSGLRVLRGDSRIHRVAAHGQARRARGSFLSNFCLRSEVRFEMVGSGAVNVQDASPENAGDSCSNIVHVRMSGGAMLHQRLPSRLRKRFVEQLEAKLPTLPYGPPRLAGFALTSLFLSLPMGFGAYERHSRSAILE